MTFWTSARVADALGTASPVSAVFPHISTDTRALIPGDLFVALQGERFDAHDFLGEARARGAAAAVVRRGTPLVPDLPLFAVEDPLAALGVLARTRRRALAAGRPVVAITGSSGKTTTKELARAALSPRYRVHATAANLNNEVGVPLTILAAPDDTEALVVEAGASVPGEIGRLRAIIEPTIAVITNVGYAHVEGFGSIASVLLRSWPCWRTFPWPSWDSIPPSSHWRLAAARAPSWPALDRPLKFKRIVSGWMRKVAASCAGSAARCASRCSGCIRGTMPCSLWPRRRRRA